MSEKISSSTQLSTVTGNLLTTQQQQPLNTCPANLMTDVFVGFTSLGGLLGLISSACVLVVIFAYRKDVYFVRERIIAGLSVANALYAILSIIPLQLYHLGPDCSAYMHFDHVAYLRMVWFAWKYAVVGYEIFILGFSIYVLYTSTPIKTLSVRTEAIGHFCCWIGASLVLIITCVTVTPIVQDHTFCHSPGTRRTGLCLPGLVGQRYNALVSQAVYGWLALFGLAIVLWFRLLWLVSRLRREWHTSLQLATQQWSKDLWHENDRPIVERKHTLMMIQKNNFEEVAQPLQRYVWVFIAFLPPAIVMSTTYCANHSNGYSVCESPAECVLAFRSLFSSLVYFYDPQCRKQLGNRHRLWDKMKKRLLTLAESCYYYRCCCCGGVCSGSGGGGGSSSGGESRRGGTSRTRARNDKVQWGVPLNEVKLIDHRYDDDDDVDADNDDYDHVDDGDGRNGKTHRDHDRHDQNDDRPGRYSSSNQTTTTNNDNTNTNNTTNNNSNNNSMNNIHPDTNIINNGSDRHIDVLDVLDDDDDDDDNDDDDNGDADDGNKDDEDEGRQVGSGHRYQLMPS